MTAKEMQAELMKRIKDLEISVNFYSRWQEWNTYEVLISGDGYTLRHQITSGYPNYSDVAQRLITMWALLRYGVGNEPGAYDG